MKFIVEVDDPVDESKIAKYIQDDLTDMKFEGVKVRLLSDIDREEIEELYASNPAFWDD